MFIEVHPLDTEIQILNIKSIDHILPLTAEDGCRLVLKSGEQIRVSESYAQISKVLNDSELLLRCKQ